MKRSEVNRLQREALALFAEHRFALPPFATWGEAEWRGNLETASYCHSHQMGWDITDFGSSDFSRRGLVIFCVRNGLQGVASEKPYAEKLLVVREDQETPHPPASHQDGGHHRQGRRQPDPRAPQHGGRRARRHAGHGDGRRNAPGARARRAACGSAPARA